MLQVLLLGQGPALLAQTLFTEAQPSGTITVPELQRLRSPLEDEYGHAAVHVHTSTVAVSPGGLAVAASPRHLPAEQAVTWAEAVLAELNAPTVLVVTSLLVRHSHKEWQGRCCAHARVVCMRCVLSATCLPSAGV